MASAVIATSIASVDEIRRREAAFYFLAGTIVIANLMVFVTPSNLRAEPQVVRL
jgi:hypothetical protein